MNNRRMGQKPGDETIMTMTFCAGLGVRRWTERPGEKRLENLPAASSIVAVIAYHSGKNLCIMRQTEPQLPYWRIDSKRHHKNNGGKGSGNSRDNIHGKDSHSNAPRDEAPRPPCPRCGKSDKVIPIIYGMPGEELFREQEAGLVRLGGCIISDEGKDLKWYCKRDREKF
jgi:hypothetical protein